MDSWGWCVPLWCTSRSKSWGSRAPPAGCQHDTLFFICVKIYTCANVYAGTPISKEDGKSFGKFKLAAERSGYSIITKPLKKIWLDRSKGEFVYKCNFDVEIAFDISRAIKNIDIVIIGSGDSDFLEAKNFSLEHKKEFIVLCFEKGIAWEMRKLHHLFLEELKDKIQH